MDPVTTAEPAELWPQERRWRALAFYNGIRTAFGLIFLILTAFGPAESPWASFRHPVLQAGAVVFLILCLLWSRTLRVRAPGFLWQSNLELILDIAAIVLLTHVTGLSTGFGTLVLAPVAVGGLLLDQRLAVTLAAAASLALLGDQVYLQLIELERPAYTQAGILGAMSFVAAFTAHGLARRAQESEALARRRGEDLRHLSRLNELVIQNMQNGIIVVGRDGRIELINAEAAHMLLAHGEQARGRLLGEIAPELAGMLDDWERDPYTGTQTLVSADGSLEIVPYFMSLGRDAQLGTLISLEDQTLVKRRMQDMKLAALGRLSASIAHEVRNPLSAMYQATQLLAESDALSEDDLRLTDMIQSHSQRINTIVENVLQLSRQPASRAELLDLARWLPPFLDSWAREHLANPKALGYRPDSGSLEVRMDAGHLQQILENLLTNARDHGRPETGELRIRVVTGILPEGNRPYLDVLDNGSGIPEELRPHIFDPFFTTGHGGTGLGLFISRELCEFNGASLSCPESGASGSCFRVVFADPKRWIG